MNAVWIALVAGVVFFAAYHTYGRFLARRVFALRDDVVVPSREVNDGVDYVPTQRPVLFGHHFTSIAGTGPIVGPAIAVFWGWLPALIWILVGNVFVGAVHDFGALVVSMRSRGQTIGDVAGRMISKRARLLVLLVLFFALMVVIAIFGLVIAVIFSVYPESVLSVWVAMPVAVVVGLWIYKRGGSLLGPSLIALGVLYGAVWLGVYRFPITLPAPELGPEATYWQSLGSPVVIWTGVLLVYCFIASVLPVWLLLQPRDYVNSHQLIVALVLLVAGLFVAHPAMVAPAIADNPAEHHAPAMFPFLFVTLACGAVSGFHSLVSSGTSSKQIGCERDALFIGYGAMLLEGALAVLVILSCCAGLGMGVTDADGVELTGQAAWLSRYGGSWADMGLPQKIGAFVEGGANMIAAVGVPLRLAVGIIAVMVACFAATTLDTATRLQRYVIQELGAALRVPGLSNKYAATAAAVITGGVIAMIPAPGKGPGTGGLILWPLFGGINQLLAGLAFLVVAFYLIRHRRPVWFLLAPLALMIVMPAWAMSIQIAGWYHDGKWLLFGIGVAVELLQGWMLVEAAVMWQRAKGVQPEPLPPLEQAGAINEGGRAC